MTQMTKLEFRDVDSSREHSSEYLMHANDKFDRAFNAAMEENGMGEGDDADRLDGAWDDVSISNVFLQSLLMCIATGYEIQFTRIYARTRTLR